MAPPPAVSIERLKTGCRFCLVLLNIPLIFFFLFLFQSLIGMGSSWILLYTAGQTAVDAITNVKHEKIFSQINDDIVTYLNRAPIALEYAVNAISMRTNNMPFDQFEMSQLMRSIKDVYLPTHAMFYASKEGDFLWITRSTSVPVIFFSDYKEMPPRFRAYLYGEDYQLGLLLLNTTIPTYITEIEWFKNKVNKTSMVWSETLGIQMGELSTHAAAPIFVNRTDGTKTPYKGEWYGTFLIDFSIEAVRQKVNTSVVDPDAFAMLIDKKGDLIAVSGRNLPINLDAKGNPVLTKGNESRSELVRSLTGFVLQGVHHDNSSEFDYIVTSTGNRYAFQIREVKDKIGIGWYIVIAVRTGNFVDTVAKSAAGVIIGSIALLVSGFIVVIFITTLISVSLRNITNEMQRLASLTFVDNMSKWRLLQSFLLRITPIHEVRTMISSLTSMKEGLRSFKKYVPVSIVKRILKEKRTANVGMEPAYCTILFTDLVNFTNITETFDSSKLIEALSQYFSEMTDIIEKQKGVVDKYIGDSIMALWNHPYDLVDGHAHFACSAALEAIKKQEELCTYWKSVGLPELRMRIGINTGNCLIGNIGSMNRLNFTSIGDNVNVASRLENLNKFFGTTILISEDTWKHVNGSFLCYFVGFVQLKGKNNVTPVYSLESRREEATEEQLSTAEKLMEAKELLMNHQFAKASETLHPLKKKLEGRKFVKMLLRQAKHSSETLVLLRQNDLSETTPSTPSPTQGSEALRNLITELPPEKEAPLDDGVTLIPTI